MTNDKRLALLTELKGEVDTLRTESDRVRQHYVRTENCFKRILKLEATLRSDVNPSRLMRKRKTTKKRK